MKIPHKYCFTPKEAAECLELSVDTVTRRIKSGYIQAFRISQREYRICRDDLMEAGGLNPEKCFLPDGIAFNRPFLARLFNCSEATILRAQQPNAAFKMAETVYASDIQDFINRNYLFPITQAA